MLKFLLTTNFFFFISVSIIYGQTVPEEENANPQQTHPLLANLNSQNVWDYQFINGDSLFREPLDISFNINSDITSIISSGLDSTNGQFTNQFNYEADTYIIQGQYKHKKLLSQSLKLGNQIFSNVTNHSLIEQYVIIVDTVMVVRYECEYFFFVDSQNNKLLEIYKKKRQYEGIDLSENYIGVGFNTLNNNNSNQIVLNCTPNPTQENSMLSFELPSSGIGTIRISNSTGSVEYQIFQGNLESGINVLPINLLNLGVDTYTIKLIFNNQQYSTTLVKL